MSLPGAAPIEALVRDGLKRAADDRALSFARIGRGAGLVPARP